MCQGSHPPCTRLLQPDVSTCQIIYRKDSGCCMLVLVLGWWRAQSGVAPLHQQVLAWRHWPLLLLGAVGWCWVVLPSTCVLLVTATPLWCCCY